MIMMSFLSISQQHLNEKGCKESDRSSNISDLKVDIRSGSCEPDGSETCSGTDSIATRLAANILGSTSGGGGGVPLAGPVKIPGEFNRYSSEYSEALSQLQPKSGQNNNGYVPYLDYTREFSPPSHTLPLRNGSSSNNATLNNSLHVTSNLNGQVTGGNLSLTRNRLDLRQDNGLPNVQGSLSSLQNGLLGKCEYLVKF